MNRNVVIAGIFILAATGALVARFGLPAYAEYKVGKALDAHIAALPDPSQGAHAGLSLDYWNDRLELARLQLPLDLPNPHGAALPLVIDIAGIVVDGYDLAALERILETGTARAGPAPLISRGSWSGFTVMTQAGRLQAGSGLAGRIDGITRLEVDMATGAVTDMSFDAMHQTDLAVQATSEMTGGPSLDGSISTLSLSGASIDRIATMTIEGLLYARLPDAAPGEEKAQAPARIALERLAISDWTRPTGNQAGTLGKLLLSNFRISGTGGSKAPQPEMLTGPAALSIASYELSDMRYDPRALEYWWAFDDVLGDTRERSAQFADLAERFLTAFERTRDLDTGVGMATAKALSLTINGKSPLTIDEVVVRDVRGLKGGTFSLTGYQAMEPDGTRIRIDEYSGTVGDLTHLPEWAREIFGRPVTVDGLKQAAAWADARPIGELLPDLDFGTFTMKGMHVTSDDQSAVSIALAAIDHMRTTRDGDVDLAFRMEGIRMPIAAKVTGMPQAASTMQMLAANGITEISLDTGLAMQVSLVEGTGNATVRVAADQLVDVILTTELTDVLFEYIRRTPPARRGPAALSSAVRTIRLTLRDLGLRELLLQGQVAQRPGATVDMIGAQLGAIAEQTGASMGTDAARAIGQQLAGFITRGGGLVVETGITTHLSIKQLLELQGQPPARIIDRLGITATHTAP